MNDCFGTNKKFRGVEETLHVIKLVSFIPVSSCQVANIRKTTVLDVMRRLLQVRSL